MVLTLEPRNHQDDNAFPTAQLLVLGMSSSFAIGGHLLTSSQQYADSQSPLLSPPSSHMPIP